MIAKTRAAPTMWRKVKSDVNSNTSEVRTYQLCIDTRRALTIVQYAGDVREASRRINENNEESHGGQRYTVGYVESLASRIGSVTTIAGITTEVYDTVLPSGLRAIGAGFKERFDGRKLLNLLRSTRPNLVILRSPIWSILLWAIATRCRTLPILADSFDVTTLKGWVKLHLLATLLRSSVFDVVANHGKRSAEQLVSAGIPANKVLAWDYPSFVTPAAKPAKDAPSEAGRILFVGMLQADKGVFDVIDAAAILQRDGRTIHVHLVGHGRIAQIAEAIAQNNLENVVSIVGPISHRGVLEQMAQADIVVVPSHHAYSEGLPKTIYEAYCSRTPLITSDHPMFSDAVVPEESGLVFSAGNARQLADQISRLLSDPLLYRKLSEGGAIAWQQTQISVKWADLIDRWLDNSQESQAWIKANSLDQKS